MKRQLFGFASATCVLALMGCGGGSGDSGNGGDDNGGTVTRKLVFTSRRTGDAAIYSMNADGSDVTRLNTGSGDVGSPDLSPDGKKIVFLRRSPDPKRPDRLAVMNSDGTNARDLPEDPDGVSAMWPRWSPDGKKIIYELSSGNICSIGSDGTDKTVVISMTVTPSVSNHEPDISPDGKKLVYVSERGRLRDLYIRNLDGTGEIALTKDGGARNEASPRWSPDGQTIVYTAYESGRADRQQVYSIRADGTNNVALTDGSDVAETPSWSPSGSKIAFIRQSADLKRRVFLMNADGTESTLLTPDDSLSFTPSW